MVRVQSISKSWIFKSWQHRQPSRFQTADVLDDQHRLPQHSSIAIAQAHARPCAPCWLAHEARAGGAARAVFVTCWGLQLHAGATSVPRRGCTGQDAGSCCRTLLGTKPAALVSAAEDEGSQDKCTACCCLNSQGTSGQQSTNAVSAAMRMNV